MLVRHKKVYEALSWLKLNHSDYTDLEISLVNLISYPENVPPVVVDYRKSSGERPIEAHSVDDLGQDDGTTNGMCPLTVHGITGQNYTELPLHALKALAIQHLQQGGKVIAIGREAEPETLWNNTQLYPMIFPWLFPYGLGGIGHKEHKGKISDLARKRHMLMYYDKRFQRDETFSLTAFNHEQIKEATTSGFLMTKWSFFAEISNRLFSFSPSTLSSIADRLCSGDVVVPSDANEKQCFQLLRDLDIIGKDVQGSLTSKHHMRNEIWSLIAMKGAPSWYITLSPSDEKHPICLYYAGTNQNFNPEILSQADRRRMISSNPMAGARFFHLMITMFIKHVLGVHIIVGNEESIPGMECHYPHGFYGGTDAYYGTVEQQGRLTLHLHMLLWINDSVSPQYLRDRVMDHLSSFQQKLVKYLEACHQGELQTGLVEQVKQQLNEKEIHFGYKNPTETMPTPPPYKCLDRKSKQYKCEDCVAYNTWCSTFQSETDDLLL